MSACACVKKHKVNPGLIGVLQPGFFDCGDLKAERIENGGLVNAYFNSVVISTAYPYDDQKNPFAESPQITLADLIAIKEEIKSGLDGHGVYFSQSVWNGVLNDDGTTIKVAWRIQDAPEDADPNIDPKYFVFRVYDLALKDFASQCEE